jgi:uncharacterized protein YndB with AHSA1/START domain
MESKGTITIEEDYGILTYERRLSHPRETIWKAITDTKEIFKWLPDYKECLMGIATVKSILSILHQDRM